MVLSLSVTALAASGDWTGDLPKLQLSTNYDKAANQVTAVVALSDCSALGALHFELLYNNALLTFKSAEGDALQGAVMHNDVPGSVRYVWAVVGSVNCSEAKNIMTVVFDSTGVGGEAAFSVHVTRVNNGQEEMTTVVAADSTLTSSVTLPAGVTQPTTPTDPDQPTNPTEPTNPDQPTNPTEPTNPDQPTQPTQPDPDQPTQPTQPDPDQPTQPTQPDPDQPTQPTQPDPDQPTQPTQPDPDQPTQPTQPDPDQPTQPTQPDPDQPTQPTQPDPDQPTQPTQPDPDQPTQPTQPDPDQPTQPTQPDPDQPDQPDEDLVVIPTGVSSDSYTIDGQTVTVQNELACRVGYLKDGKYVALEATRTESGVYVFTAPEGVEQVLLVVKGDANGDGKVTVADILQILAYTLDTGDLNAAAQFAANVDGNDSITVADILSILAHTLDQKTLEW